MRPVRCRNPDGKLWAADPDRCRGYGVIPLAAGMRTTPVSRDDIRRSRPDSMKNLFYDNSDFATVRGALITALQPEHQEVTGKLRGRQINTLDKRARERPYARRTQIEAILREFAGVAFHGQLEVEGMAGAAVAAAAGGQLPVAAAAGAAVVKDRSTKWQPSEHLRVNGPHEVAASGCPCAQGLKFP